VLLPYPSLFSLLLLTLPPTHFFVSLPLIFFSSLPFSRSLTLSLFTSSLLLSLFCHSLFQSLSVLLYYSSLFFSISSLLTLLYSCPFLLLHPLFFALSLSSSISIQSFKLLS
jgi:hypothetical protein